MRIIILILFIFLQSCASTKIIEKPTFYMREKLGCNLPDDITFEDVRFTIKREGDTYFIIDVESYKNIILNNKKIENWMIQSKKSIELCEGYYTKPIK